MVCGDQKYIYPADFFHPDAPIPETPLVNKYFTKVVLPVATSGSLILGNYLVSKPLYSAIHKHFIALPVAFAIACFYDNYLVKKCARRDAIIYDYIITHPKDFPPIERVKYKDCLDRWVPKRFQ
ncbi:UNVERIFIED_CONTAM: hypothetical protein RMT77_007450 [Armadillidium vulgare]